MWNTTCVLDTTPPSVRRARAARRPRSPRAGRRGSLLPRPCLRCVRRALDISPAAPCCPSPGPAPRVKVEYKGASLWELGNALIAAMREMAFSGEEMVTGSK
jgi:hypothetical protein